MVRLSDLHALRTLLLTTSFYEAISKMKNIENFLAHGRTQDDDSSNTADYRSRDIENFFENMKTRLNLVVREGVDYSKFWWISCKSRWVLYLFHGQVTDFLHSKLKKFKFQRRRCSLNILYLSHKPSFMKYPNLENVIFKYRRVGMRHWMQQGMMLCQYYLYAFIDQSQEIAPKLLKFLSFPLYTEKYLDESFFPRLFRK